jgi:hypothetical protein
MTLDLDELTAGWDCPPGELRARVVVGRDGAELLQLRVDLGVMQMLMDGRPDGQRCHGLPTAREYVEHELRVAGNAVAVADWQELDRELAQTNYRRVAYSTLAEDALQDNEPAAAQRFIAGALRDTEACLTSLRLLQRQEVVTIDQNSLRPTLAFDRTRLLAQLRVVEGDFESAIEEAEAGANALDRLLAELGYDEEQREQDPGVAYLMEFGQRLRQEYGIAQTLREALEQAIENEDFERAAELRDELQRRTISPPNADQPGVSPRD